jgi:hypothetical protein
LTDSRWDMTYPDAGATEGVALAAFGHPRLRRESIVEVGSVRDVGESRHVAFKVALRDFYPQLTDHDERARGVRRETATCCAIAFSARRSGNSVFGRGMLDWVDHSELMRVYRSSLFTRIVLTIRDIGLWDRGSARRTPTWVSLGSPTRRRQM